MSLKSKYPNIILKHKKLKEQQKYKNMELLERLEQLRDNNPNFASAIEEAFPEIRNNAPIIWAHNDNLMMREGHKNIYKISYENGMFSIFNISHGKSFKHSVKSSGEDNNIPYLSIYDFKRLLKLSMVKFESIRILSSNNINVLYNDVFKDQ